MSFPSPQQERTLLSYLYFWLSARQWWVFVFIGPTQTHSVFGKRCWEISLHTAQSMGNLLHSGRIIAGQRNLLITPRIGWKTTSFWLVSSCWFGSKRLKVKFLLLAAAGCNKGISFNRPAHDYICRCFTPQEGNCFAISLLSGGGERYVGRSPASRRLVWLSE